MEGAKSNDGMANRWLKMANSQHYLGPKLGVEVPSEV